MSPTTLKDPIKLYIAYTHSQYPLITLPPLSPPPPPLPKRHLAMAVPKFKLATISNKKCCNFHDVQRMNS